RSPCRDRRRTRQRAAAFPDVLNGAPRGSARSLRALEWLNAIVADVRAGVGPYLAIYLRASRHWDPEQIGLAMSAMDLASVLGQTPAGALTDRARGKRLLVVAAAVGVARPWGTTIARLSTCRRASSPHSWS